MYSRGNLSCSFGTENNVQFTFPEDYFPGYNPAPVSGEMVYAVFYHHPLDKTNVLTLEIMEDAAKLLYLGVLKIARDENL